MAASSRLFSLQTRSVFLRLNSTSVPFPTRFATNKVCHTSYLHTTNCQGTLHLHKISRCMSTERKKSEKHALEVKKPGAVTRRALAGYMRYLERFERHFEKRMPKVFQMYKTFKDGFTDFLKDSRTYYGITTSVWGGEPFANLTRADLELYKQTPSFYLVEKPEYPDIIPAEFLLLLMNPEMLNLATELLKASRVPDDVRKMAPMLILSIVPFGQYLLLPLVFSFPTHLLSRHFWSPEQLLEYRRRIHRKCILHYLPLLMALKKCGKGLSQDDSRLLNKVLDKAQSQELVTREDIVSLIPVFSTDALQLENLSHGHLRHLRKSFDIRRKKLEQTAYILHNIDKHILKEGVTTLTDSDLQLACFWRGRNPTIVHRSYQERYLSEWLYISKHIDDTSISLLLHCHVFLLYQNLIKHKPMNFASRGDGLL